MAKKERPVRRAQGAHKRATRKLAKVPPPSDPTMCPMCQSPFTVVVGCHKICRCGYEEGCGD